MANYNLVADVSSHNPDTLAFFKQLQQLGVKAVIVKLTEGSNPGTAYANPKAGNQIKHARQCGMRVHAYHFARFVDATDAVHEAMWFITHIRCQGLAKDSVMVVDVEAPEIPRDANKCVNTFLRVVKQVGYPNTDVYASASWFWAGRLKPALLIPKNLWVANYNRVKPGVDHVGTWQYTNNFNGLHVDMSYDFFGHYTGKIANNDVAQAHYTVVSGDSWWGIAHKHNLNMYDLAKLNGKTIDSVIHPGDRLRIR